MREPDGEVPSLGLRPNAAGKDQGGTFRQGTGRSDRKTFSLATTCHVNLPASFFRACLLTVLCSLGFPCRTMVNVELRGNPAWCEQ